MAIYRVTAFGTYFGQQIINKFDYVSSGAVPTTGGAFALARELIGEPGEPIAEDVTAAWQDWILNVNNAYILREVQVANLYDPIDYYVEPISAQVGAGGAVSTNAMSPFVAYGFRTNRVRSDIRRGQRRLVGVREETVGQFGELEAGFITTVISIASSFTQPIEHDSAAGNTIYTPAVMSFEAYETDSGRTAYKKYATEAAQLDRTAVGVVWSALSSITTQNSRKVGRGS